MTLLATRASSSTPHQTIKTINATQNQPDTQRPERRHYLWMLAYLRPRGKETLVVLFLALLTTSVAMLTPWLTKHIIDDGIIARDQSSLGFWIGCMLIATLASAGLGALNRRRYLDLSSGMLMNMRHDVFAHLGTLSPRFYLQFTQGELISRMDGDIGEVQRFALDSLLAAINGVLALIAAIALMLVLSPKLTALTFILLPASVLFLKLIRPRLERETRRMRERSADISALLIDRLPSMRLLQTLLAVGETISALDDRQKHYREQLLRSQMLGYWVSTVPGLFNTLATATVFFVGGSAVIDDELSLGALIAFASYLGRATGPVNTLLGVYVATQRAGVSLMRVHTLLDSKATVTELQTTTALPPLSNGVSGQLRFKHCEYHPSDGQKSLWAPLQLEIPAAARVWVSGASGAGKSTLLALLQRHEDPVAGSIELDGVALPELSLQQLRSAVVLLEQDAPMLDTSVRENLCLGLKRNDQELQDLLVQVRLEQWLSTLPAGLDARLGNRGARLSGGERHRLALARALLRKPRVLLLDETTSALDPELEDEIWQTVDSASGQQTLLIVSHQRPTIQGLSHRLHLENQQWTMEKMK